MIFEEFWLSIRRAWAYVPLPWIILAIMLLGFVWLWVEYQTTRAARALPFWRKPVPLFAEISVGVGWLIRISRGLMIIWIVLFVAMTLNFWIGNRSPNYPAAISRFLTSAGRIWRQGYVFVADRLPEATPEWLLPPALEEADRGV